LKSKTVECLTDRDPDHLRWPQHRLWYSGSHPTHR
jgi:hypothetical protein